MSEIYDNWERVVAAVLRKEKDRELCYLSSSPSSGSSSDSPSSPSHDILSLDFSGPGAGSSSSSSSSHRQDHHQALIPVSVFPRETISINTSRLREVVFKVDLSHVEPMKRFLKTVDLLSRIGICFAADVRDAEPKNLVMKAVSSFSGVHSIALNKKENRLTVVGDFNIVAVVRKLRKSGRYTELVSVGRAERIDPAHSNGDDGSSLPVPVGPFVIL